MWIMSGHHITFLCTKDVSCLGGGVWEELIAHWGDNKQKFERINKANRRE